MKDENQTAFPPAPPAISRWARRRAVLPRGSPAPGCSGRDATATPLALARALGGLKGPLMKAAQLIATIPEALPADYAEALTTLQSEAPPMGAAFVKRRMVAELGADWRDRFSAFDLHPAAAASLGQVHRAMTLDGVEVACKLQYPDMASAVEADHCPARARSVAASADGSGRSTRATPRRKSRSACARSSIMSARPATPGFTG